MSEPTSPVPPPPRSAIDGQLRSIGKGVVQANLRLARVIEVLDTTAGIGGEPARPDAMPALFDLIDALDAALSHADGLPVRRRLFGLLPPAPRAPDPAWRGLQIALSQAVEQLDRLGVRAVHDSGALDPRRHRVVGRIPCKDPEQGEEIAVVQARGWCTGDGDGERILRPACVQVWAPPVQEPES